MDLPPSVKLTEPVEGYPVYEVNHATCSGKVALHGAHVMSWKPVDEEEVLYLSPDAIYKEGNIIEYCFENNMEDGVSMADDCK